MKILHTSDWHLGLDFYGHSLSDEHRSMIAQIAEIAREKSVSAILIAGDIFDRAVVGPEAIALYNEAMGLLCLQGRTKVILCAGNHDGASRLSTLSDLLEYAGLYVVGKVTREDKCVDLGECVVHVLPYVTTDDVRIAYPEQQEAVTSSVEAFRIALSHRKPPKDGKKHILLAHCFAAGGEVSDTDRAAAAGGSLAIPTEWFEDYDYVALGHLHRPQSLDGGSIRYSGTPICTSFAEAGQEKSVTILDTDSMEKEIVPLHPLHGMEKREGTLHDLLQGKSDNYMQLTLTDRMPTAGVQEELRLRYPNALLFSYARENEQRKLNRLTVEEARQETPLSVAKRFYLYKTGQEMDEEQEKWMQDAILEAEKEE